MIHTSSKTPPFVIAAKRSKQPLKVHVLIAHDDPPTWHRGTLPATALLMYPCSTGYLQHTVIICTRTHRILCSSVQAVKRLCFSLEYHLFSPPEVVFKSGSPASKRQKPCEPRAATATLHLKFEDRRVANEKVSSLPFMCKSWTKDTARHV